MDVPAFFDTSPCGNYVISVPFFFGSCDYPVMNRTSIFTLFGVEWLLISLEPVLFLSPREHVATFGDILIVITQQRKILLSSTG